LSSEGKDAGSIGGVFCRRRDGAERGGFGARQPQDGRLFLSSAPSDHRQAIRKAAPRRIDSASCSIRPRLEAVNTDRAKPDDIYFIRSRGSASFFKVTSLDPKPLTTDQANEFAKRQVRVDIGRQGAEAISKSALADAKFEGDYARIMTAAAPAAATPARWMARRRRSRLAAGETQKEQPGI
jgi:hypothetical protein